MSKVFLRPFSDQPAFKVCFASTLTTAMNRVVMQEASESFQVEHAEQRIASALAALNEAKGAHTASMGKLSDIEASIQRCEYRSQ